MNHLQTLNLALQGKNKIASDHTQTIFSIQNKIRVYQRDISSRKFSHFSNLSRRVNTFLDIEIKDHKLDEYKDKLQGLFDNFLDRFDDLWKLKPCFTYLVNPFMVDVINDGCPILESLVTESSAVEMEPRERMRQTIVHECTLNARELHSTTVEDHGTEAMAQSKRGEHRQK